jgi:hypothetical protein
MRRRDGGEQMAYDGEETSVDAAYTFFFDNGRGTMHDTLEPRCLAFCIVNELGPVSSSTPNWVLKECACANVSAG